MKKIIYTILIIIFSSSLSYSIGLNKYGHIIDNNKQSLDAEYIFRNNGYQILTSDLTLHGNTLLETYNGFVTITTIEDNFPTTLRIYNKKGNLEYKKEFKKIINITLSNNKHYLAFFDSNGIRVMDLDRLNFHIYSGSCLFTISDKGEIAYYKNDTDEICLNNYKHLVNKIPRKLLFYNNKLLVFFKKGVYKLFRNNLKLIKQFKDQFFEAKIINNNLYIVEKRLINGNFNFVLYHTSDFKKYIFDEEKIFKRSENKTHEPIKAPLNYASSGFPFEVGNSYAEIQEYGSTPYLHPGVDFLGDDYEDVFAVKSGYVKAILTTGGSAYWRIAIAEVDTPAETEGYLYAHLNQTSIPYSVGDYVNEGDFVGTLYPWGWYDFTHIHFSRISCSGSIWNGDWWTTDDSQIDITNLIDIIPPTFQNSYYSNLFAFRDQEGSYLDPGNLFGEIDIIAKCYDTCNSSWKIDVWELRYKLHPIDNPDSTIYEQLSFIYDMPLDTYISGSYDWMVLNTIYSRDAVCFSTGNYTEREYYHVITHSDGDSVITGNDALQTFDTTVFPDDSYILEVIAKDASQNQSSAFMEISICNAAIDDEISNINKFKIKNYPEPFSSSTKIYFNFQPVNNKNAFIEIFNIKGQKVRTIPLNNITRNTIIWDGKDDNNMDVLPGVFFSKLYLNEKLYFTDKMILLR